MTVPKQAALKKKKQPNSLNLLLENAHFPLIDTCIMIQSVPGALCSNCHYQIKTMFSDLHARVLLRL